MNDGTWAVYEPDGILNSLWATERAARNFCAEVNAKGAGGWTWGAYEPEVAAGDA